jgi:hypothetical protein
MEETKVEQTVVDPLKEVKAKLTDAEKESFFKAFLADAPYEAEESLFNGKLIVKFKTLSVGENNLVMQQLQFDRDNGTAKNSDAYLIQVIQYRIAASMTHFDKQPFAIEINEETSPTDVKAGQTYLIKRLEVMKEWPTFKVSSLTDAFNRFEKKVRALTEESFKENF